MRADLRMSPAGLSAIGIVLALAIVATRELRAFDVGGGWPNGTIEVNVLLDTSTSKPTIPAGGFTDGGNSWNEAVMPAFAEWNAVMQRTKFNATTTSGVGGASNNGVNEVFFAPNVFGEPFGTNVLAVTLSRRAGTSGLRFREADVIFNTAKSWNSYRGTVRSAFDIQRVALHEFGHALGLDHPDEVRPVAQNVAAIMNSRIGNVYQLQPDDIGGANRIYDQNLRQPLITANPPAALALVEGTGKSLLSAQIDNGIAPPESDILKYSWLFRPPGGSIESLFTVNRATLLLGAAQLDDAGTYQLAVETPLGESIGTSTTVTVASTPQGSATRLENLSTRGIAGTGDRALIVGFVISSDTPRRILLRGIGPALASTFGVAGTVTDPMLDLKNNASQTVASNDDWQSGGNEAALQQAFSQAGAFPLPSGSADAAVVATLPPGSYTALVTSKSGVEGLAIVEAYDLDGAASGNSRLTNLSTRGFVGTGSNIMIAGFVVSGNAPRKYLIRGVGDTLGTLGVTGFLDDATLELYDNAGTLLRLTDDWDSPAFLQPKLLAAFTAAGAVPFTDRQESAMLLTLQPGAYTVHLAGLDDSTGIALAEIYEVNP